MKILIAINETATGKIPPGDPRWATFNDRFLARDLEPVEIANEIYTGHAYAGIHQGRRSLENFVASQHIAIDMDSADERSAFATLQAHDLVRMYGGMMHTTPSHTDAAPRARVIFFLDKPITDAGGFQTAAKFLVSQFDGADPACTDASRFFYGSKGCDIWFSDNVLPVAQLRQFWRRWNATQHAAPREGIVRMEEYRAARPTAQRGTDVDFGMGPKRHNLDALLDPVRNAAQGNRNNALNRQSFLAGKDVTAGRIGESEIVEHLLRAALAAGLDEHEALRTIRSGMRGGLSAMGA
jgi:hypothetical protein